MEVIFFWFRRDLRLEDNVGLFHALKKQIPVIPLFIFDTTILHHLKKDDARVGFIHDTILTLNTKLNTLNSQLLVKHGNPVEVWKQIIADYNISEVITNHDYEPQAIKRDKAVAALLNENGIQFKSYKDQVVFEKDEIIKPDGTPYTVYTPYMKRWKEKLRNRAIKQYSSEKLLDGFYQFDDILPIPDLQELGFTTSNIPVKNYSLKKDTISSYESNRNFPAVEVGSYLGLYLRFGIVSIREVILQTVNKSDTFLNELIWREFFMQILYHFPHVVSSCFKKKYDHINWINHEKAFEKWCKGETGYPLVDAGMRELNNTGYMHNRVRMVTASFLCKHLLIDWRWGEAYFAEKLLDFELSSNNGNWQWVAGTGCDAAPYFRIFNPTEQLKKFDSDMLYIKKWVPEVNDLFYINFQIIEHKFARERALRVYKEGINSNV